MKFQQGQIGWIILVFVAIVLSVIVFLTLNSSNSIPGDTLYPFKQFKENLIQAGNELSYEGRANLFIASAEERLRELELLVKNQLPESYILVTLQRLADQEDKAFDSMERLRSRGTNITVQFNKMEQLLQKQKQILPVLSYQVVGNTLEELQKGLTFTDEALARLESFRYNLK